MSALRDIIQAAASGNGGSMTDYTVLAVQHDPYRLDTPAKHRDGQWLAEHIDRLDLNRRRIHLRGLHYALVSSTVLKPNGEPYCNTEDDWNWLGEHPAKAARWLGYIPFDRIVDARNESPVISRHKVEQPAPEILAGKIEVRVPEVEYLRPEVFVNFEARQRHHLVIFGEKTSLSEVVAPVAKRLHADLYLPAGEISDTLLYQMARDGAEDGRPMIVFTLADCDPAGWQMPVSIGHKLRALRDLHFPTLEFEVRPVALTVDQVKQYGLPSTPLRATERRASRWREAFGIEQTEVDALATLRPDLLREILEEAIEPFFDSTLSGRVSFAHHEWIEEAQRAIDDQIDLDLLTQLREQALARLDEIEPQIDAVNAALRSATDDLDLDLPPIEIPEPDLNGKPSTPLVSSEWPFEKAARALRDRKRYAEDAGSAS